MYKSTLYSTRRRIAKLAIGPQSSLFGHTEARNSEAEVS